MKIQINSLAALERLIGGDNQLEFEIRQSVAEAFARKHLKTISSTELFKKASAGISDEVNKMFLEEVKGGWGSPKFKLNSEAQALVKDNIKKHFDDSIYSITREFSESDATRKKIETELKRATEYIVAELTNVTLQDRLNKMVDTRLKEKLGLK